LGRQEEFVTASLGGIRAQLRSNILIDPKLTLLQRDRHVLVPHLVGPPDEGRERARAVVEGAHQQVDAEQQEEREQGRGGQLRDAVRPVELAGRLREAAAKRSCETIKPN
jgi:hypothetical protein